MYRARSKRAERRRLILTYTLVPLLIAAVVALLVFYMLGYRFSLANRTVTQGGLIQLSSLPTGADVTIDTYKLPSQTTTRYDASAGLHTVTMHRDGYLPWQKTVTVEPGKVLWLNYARLIPEKIEQSTVQAFANVDSSVASPNGQTFVVIPDATKPLLTHIALGDTVRQTDITLPASLYQTPTKQSRFTVTKLSSSGRYALVKHTLDSEYEWLFIDTRSPDQSRNISELVGRKIDEPIVGASDERRLYVIVDHTLRQVDTEQQTVSAPLIDNVAEVSQSANGVLAYVSQASGTPKQRAAGYYTPGATKPHVIRTFYDDGRTVLRLRLAKYMNDDYVVLQYGTSIEISSTRLVRSDNGQDLSLTSVATLAVPDGADNVSFSPSGRFVVSQRASTYLTYDLELNSLSTSSLKGEAAVTRSLSWLDNYILWSDRDNTLRLYEFDGANSHTIGAVIGGQAAILSSDGKYLYAFQTSSDGTPQLVRFHLRTNS